MPPRLAGNKMNKQIRINRHHFASPSWGFSSPAPLFCQPGLWLQALSPLGSSLSGEPGCAVPRGLAHHPQGPQTSVPTCLPAPTTTDPAGSHPWSIPGQSFLCVPSLSSLPGPFLGHPLFTRLPELSWLCRARLGPSVDLCCGFGQPTNDILPTEVRTLGLLTAPPS